MSGASRSGGRCNGPVVDADNAIASQARVGPDTFLAIEKWVSMDALKAHAASPHMAAYAGRVKDMIAGRTVPVLASA